MLSARTSGLKLIRRQNARCQQVLEERSHLESTLDQLRILTTRSRELLSHTLIVLRLVLFLKKDCSRVPTPDFLPELYHSYGPICVCPF